MKRTPNPNTDWLETPSGWAGYLLVILVIRIFMAYIPYISSEIAWTLTNVSHNVITLIAFHFVKGVPFEDQTTDQGKFKKLTFWEQIDDQQQFSPTKKFLTAVPVLLFLASTFFVDYSSTTFLINFISLCIVIFPKFPVMHKVRLFGLNKD